MALKHEKADLMIRINETLKAAGIQAIPGNILYRLTLKDLQDFKDMWVAPVVGNLMAYGVRRPKGH